MTRNYIRAYTIEHHRRGRPVLLGAAVDQPVGPTTVFAKVAGGVVNSVIALAAARGIQKATGSGQLHELGRSWSKSFMECMGFVMRKATKTAKKLPPNSDELKESYDIMAENSISADLIVTWDQTGVRMVFVNEA